MSRCLLHRPAFFVAPKVFIILLCCVRPVNADISSVGYIHSQIMTQKGVSIPIPSGINSAHVASERYLMEQIDAANLALNGRATSNHVASARKNIVAHDKALNDINNLIVYQVPTTYTFDSNTTFIVPAGFTKIDVFAVGGGGGGGGDAYRAGQPGGGGYGGNVVYTTINVTPGQSIPVTIGAGGTGGSHQVAGGAGGTTTFGSVSAAGGAGGAATGLCYDSSSNGACGSTGWDGTDGVACPIDVPIASGNLFGARGGGGTNSYGGYTHQSAGGRTGGGTGGGGYDNAAENWGGTGTFYGAGGGGAAFSSGHGYSVGGNGYKGIVIIQLHN